MIKIGLFNQLKIVKEVSFGVYLDGDELGEILLPRKFVPSNFKLNDILEVFVYFDSDDKIIATTQRPRALVGSCAFLKVIDINRVGAFLDWGLDKDLLVPGPEQYHPMEKNKSYIVYVKQDNKGRIIASSKLDHFLDKSPAYYQQGEEVDLIIAEKTNLGNKVIINDSHWGLIHSADIFRPIFYGKRVRGYIKMIREDGKMDISLRKTGPENTYTLADHILKELHHKGGFLPLHDKSTPEEIKRALGESKKSFKNAIGHLYKKGEINIETNGIRLRNKITP